MIIDERLLEPGVDQVFVEFTTRCNLRCAYCAVSQPGYVQRDLELDHGAIARQVIALHPREVQINGHGETTLLDHWYRAAGMLLGRVPKVSLTSHLNQKFRDDEILMLCRLSILTVSCDTADPVAYAELRRGGRLARVEENLERIQKMSLSCGMRPPYIAINCTLTHRNVAGLPMLVRWASFHGASGVSVTNLLKYQTARGADALLHPAEVDPVATQHLLEETRTIAQRIGIDFNVMPGLDEALASAAERRTRQSPAA